MNHGEGGNDILVGSDSVQGDSLYSGTGDDILVAGLGTDDLQSGDGIDIAVLMGNRADYIVTMDNRYSEWDIWFNFTTAELSKGITKSSTILNMCSLTTGSISWTGLPANWLWYSRPM